MKEKVVDLTIEENNIVLEASHIYQVTDVILATGHSRNYLSEKEAENQSYAKENNLFYQGPGNPSDTQLDHLVEGDVIDSRFGQRITLPCST